MTTRFTLAELFVSQRKVRIEDSDMSFEQLEEMLQALVARAQAHWPEFTIEPVDFVEFIATRLPTSNFVELLQSDLAADGLYLACACLQRNEKALEIISQKISQQVVRVGARLGLDKTLLQDYQQQIQEDLLFGQEASAPLLSQYRGEGDLQAWLNVLLLRRFLRFRKSEQKSMPLEEAAFECMSLDQTETEIGYLKNHYMTEFKEVFTQALSQLSSQERNLLRYYIVDGLNIDQIGAIYGVHRATVSRWLGRIRELLHIRTKRLLRDCAGVNLEEFDSIVRLIRSRLNITFSGVLTPTDADDEEALVP